MDMIDDFQLAAGFSGSSEDKSMNDDEASSPNTEKLLKDEIQNFSTPHTSTSRLHSSHLLNPTRNSVFLNSGDHVNEQGQGLAHIRKPTTNVQSELLADFFNSYDSLDKFEQPIVKRNNSDMLGDRTVSTFEYTEGSDSTSPFKKKKSDLTKPHNLNSKLVNNVTLEASEVDTLVAVNKNQNMPSSSSVLLEPPSLSPWSRAVQSLSENSTIALTEVNIPRQTEVHQPLPVVGPRTQPVSSPLVNRSVHSKDNCTLLSPLKLKRSNSFRSVPPPLPSHSLPKLLLPESVDSHPLITTEEDNDKVFMDALFYKIENKNFEDALTDIERQISSVLETEKRSEETSFVLSKYYRIKAFLKLKTVNKEKLHSTCSKFCNHETKVGKVEKHNSSFDGVKSERKVSFQGTNMVPLVSSNGKKSLKVAPKKQSRRKNSDVLVPLKNRFSEMLEELWHLSQFKFDSESTNTTTGDLTQETDDANLESMIPPSGSDELLSHKYKFCYEQFCFNLHKHAFSPTHAVRNIKPLPSPTNDTPPHSVDMIRRSGASIEGAIQLILSTHQCLKSRASINSSAHSTIYFNNKSSENDSIDKENVSRKKDENELVGDAYAHRALVSLLNLHVKDAPTPLLITATFNSEELSEEATKLKERQVCQLLSMGACCLESMDAALYVSSKKRNVKLIIAFLSSLHAVLLNNNRKVPSCACSVDHEEKEDEEDDDDDDDEADGDDRDVYHKRKCCCFTPKTFNRILEYCRKGKNALVVAIECKDVSSVRLLLQWGATVRKEAVPTETPISCKDSNNFRSLSKSCFEVAHELESSSEKDTILELLTTQKMKEN